MSNLTQEDRSEIAATISAFLNGTCGPHDWDDLISIPRNSAEGNFICDYCAFTQHLYPPAKKGEWCNDSGAKALRAVIDLLISEVEFHSIRTFIEKECNAAEQDAAANP
jgi:hypothetical protein